MTTTYTVTLNPALDISGMVEQLVPDEKNYVLNEIRTPGGNGINAAIIAHRLGTKVVATGLLGGNTGKEIQMLLNKDKVKHDFVFISGNTRMNLTVSEKKSNLQTRLSFPGPKIMSSELKKLDKLLQKSRKGNLVLFGGSLPPGISPSTLARIVRDLRKKGVICMVDVPGKVLSEVIASRPYFIKPNLTEFQQMAGKKVVTIKAILPMIRKLNKEVPLICVSSVEGGALLVSKDQAFFGRIPKVKINSTVGAGDSMVGAMMHLLSKDLNTPLEILLREGLAASCATLTEKGMTLGSKKSIQHFRPLVLVREI